MIAKLVYMSMVTRVIVEDDASEKQIIEKAKDQLIDKIKTDLDDNNEEIIDDTVVIIEECPYNSNNE